MFGFRSNRSDVFNGIMAAHIFPSLADVLTETLERDEFGALDLSLHNMTGMSSYTKGLDESDFMNQDALADDIKEEPQIHELSQPDDLLVHLPLWSQNQSFSHFVGEGDVLVGCEIEIPNKESPLNTYPRSPESTGYSSDYSSDSSSENNGRGNDRMITLQRVQLGKTECYDRNHGYMNSENYENVQIKNEPSLPDPSILPSYLEDQDDTTDSGSEESESKDCYSDCKRKRPGRKKGQTSSVYHLWEFIRDLLHDPRYCPKIIKWESEEDGIFRVVKSNEVAKQWGSKKKNRSKMTYEKLSRSLRYSRKEGYFAAIPKDRGYPKKLCFKFGPKSHGWKKPNTS